MMDKKNIWITGASSGIGAATALRLAQDGHRVYVTARSEDDLKALEKKSGALSGHIIAKPGDVTDVKKMEALVAEIEKDVPLDLAIFNAGTYKPDPVESFSLDNFKMHYELNVYGTANALKPVLDKFLNRRAGQICIVGSVAGYRGLPRSIGYGSSKAALINMAEALNIECRGYGVKVQVANPGFVRTPLTDKNDFDMPMLMEVEDAADAFVKGLYSNQFEITFPWLFCRIKRTIDLLPNRLYLWLIGKGKENMGG